MRRALLLRRRRFMTCVLPKSVYAQMKIMTPVTTAAVCIGAWCSIMAQKKLGTALPQQMKLQIRNCLGACDQSIAELMMLHDRFKTKTPTDCDPWASRNSTG